MGYVPPSQSPPSRWSDRTCVTVVFVVIAAYMVAFATAMAIAVASR